MRQDHKEVTAYKGSLTRLKLFVMILSCALALIGVLHTSEVRAHAWAKQKPVLFLSAEIGQNELKITLCLPAPLLNEIITQPIDPNYALTPAQQKSLFDELERYFQTHNPIKVDGVRALPNLTALDLVLSAPLKELEEAALAEQVKLHSGNEGAAIMSFEIGLKRTPKLISLLWDNDSLWVKMGKQSSQQLSSKVLPGVFIYQDELSPIKLTPEDPEQIWRPIGPRLKSPPPSALSLIPPPPATILDHPQFLLIWLLIFGTSLLFLRNSSRRPIGLVLALFCLLAPLSLWIIPGASQIWSSKQKELSNDKLRSIFELLHQNIYRAFDYERDEEIYDALSESVTGPLLDWTFQEIYRSLILQDEGGAKAKVSLVKPLSWERSSLQERELKALSVDTEQASERHAKEASAFAVNYRWRVIGEVTHWGHSHRRVNDYEARYAIAHTSQGWRIFSVKSRGNARRPELEGGL